MITIEEERKHLAFGPEGREQERQRLAGYINHSATVYGPDYEKNGRISVTEDKIIYSDGYAIHFDFPLEKAVAVVNFFKSCGSTIGAFLPTS